LAEIHDDCAGEPRRGSAVSIVLAGGNRGERDLGFVRDPHDRLNIFDATRRQNGGRCEMSVLLDGIGVLEFIKSRGIGEDPLISYRFAKGGQSTLKLFRRNVRRQGGLDSRSLLLCRHMFLPEGFDFWFELRRVGGASRDGGLADVLAEFEVSWV
jgi:hypothetical protein